VRGVVLEAAQDGDNVAAWMQNLGEGHSEHKENDGTGMPRAEERHVHTSTDTDRALGDSGALDAAAQHLIDWTQALASGLREGDETAGNGQVFVAAATATYPCHWVPDGTAEGVRADAGSVLRRQPTDKLVSELLMSASLGECIPGVVRRILQVGSEEGVASLSCARAVSALARTSGGACELSERSDESAPTGPPFVSSAAFTWRLLLLSRSLCHAGMICWQLLSLRCLPVLVSTCFVPPQLLGPQVLTVYLCGAPDSPACHTCILHICTYIQRRVSRPHAPLVAKASYMPKQRDNVPL